MKHLKLLILGLGVSCLLASGASAQGRGLLGERYLGFDGGWERLENDTSDDGWGAGAELNLPFPMTSPNMQFGSDLNVRFDYADILDRDIWDIEAVLRGYMTPGQGFTPFAGVGFGWVDFDLEDTMYLPVEAGLEFALGPMALTPFFRYSFAFDSAVDDFWSVGARGVYWFPDTGWGLTASVIYTDYDEFDGIAAIDSGIGVRLGVVFSY